MHGMAIHFFFKSNCKYVNMKKWTDKLIKNLGVEDVRKKASFQGRGHKLGGAEDDVSSSSGQQVWRYSFVLSFFIIYKIGHEFMCRAEVREMDRPTIRGKFNHLDSRAVPLLLHRVDTRLGLPGQRS
jgi:hypothetical protein